MHCYFNFLIKTKKPTSQITISNGTKKYISTSNPEKSNWVRYIRPAPTRKQRNVAVVYKDDQLYFITCRNISKGEEILYWTDDPDLLWTKKKSDKKSKWLKLLMEQQITRY